MPLPIIQRELGLASRRRATIWFRIAAAAVAILIGTAGIAIQQVSGGSATVGRAVFSMLTWLCLAGVLTAGLFLTSDALSEEKRAGTLGLLFLTDLRGYDVVLGKLAATSLRGFEALLAMFPVLAISLIAGGVQGAEFWKTCLALVNILFCSNAAGLFASAASREHLPAVARTILVLVVLLAGGPLIDGAIASYTGNSFEPRFALGSPMFVFLTAGNMGVALFWKGLLISHLVGWLVLGITCVRLPRVWQERPRKDAWGRRSRGILHRFSPTPLRGWLDRNPVQWLASRERRQVIGLWVIGLGIGGLYAVVAMQSPQQGMFVGTMVYSLLTPVLYIWIAVRTCSFFSEARRSGFFELLMVTPVGPAQIVQGFWSSFLRVFGGPLVLYFVVQLLGAAVGMSFSKRSSGFLMLSGLSNWGTMLASTAASVVTSVTNIIAVVWFGMWMGLVSRNTGSAALKTVVLVLVLPWFAISFISVMALPLLMLYPALRGGNSGQTFLALTMTLGVFAVPLLYVAKNVAFVFWSRKRLLGSFRAQVSSGPAGIRFSARPIAVKPPVISTPGTA